jgi:hypothetical protein
MSYDNDWDELILYADNDEPIYRRKKAFLDNVRRKIERGVYDAAKAPALWVYWVTEAARKYEKEFPGTHFTVAARKKAAEIVAKRELEMLMAGEYGPPPAFKATRTRKAHSPASRYCPVGTRAQTVLFDRSRFTRADAVAWARRAGFQTRSVEVGPKVIHLRQASPQSFRKAGFRHKKIAPGVAIVVGCPK